MNRSQKHIERPEFSAALDAALRAAALSPSSHNSQPWAVIWLESEAARRSLIPLGLRARAGCEYLTLALDLDRVLSALPGHAIEMHLSCGAFLHALVTQLRASGYEPSSIDYHTAPIAHPAWPEETRRLQPQCTLALRVSATRERATRRPVQWSSRITQRGPYRTTPLAPEVVRELERACATTIIDPALSSSARVHVFQDRGQMQRAGRVIRRYAALDYTHRAAWSETYRYIGFEDPTRSARHDGLPITQLLGDMSATQRRLAQFALAPARMSLLRRIGVPELLAASTAAQFRAGPALIALTLEEADGSLPQRMAAGCALMQTWLTAASHELGMHPLSVLVQHDEARAALQEALGLRRRLYFFARLGHPSKPLGPAPKRPYQELLRTL